MLKTIINRLKTTEKTIPYSNCNLQKHWPWNLYSLVIISTLIESYIVMNHMIKWVVLNMMVVAMF